MSTTGNTNLSVFCDLINVICFFHITNIQKKYFISKCGFISGFYYLYNGGKKMNDMNIYLQKNWKSIRNKVRKVTKNHQNTDDLLNDLVVTLLEKPYEYQQNLLDNNKVQHWFVSSASLQFKSATSPFFYKYKSFVMKTNSFEEWQHPQEEEDVPVEEKVVQFIKSELDLYNVYERTLVIEHLFNEKSYSEIGREYKINRRFISETITPVKNEIFEKVKDKWNF